MPVFPSLSQLRRNPIAVPSRENPIPRSGVNIPSAECHLLRHLQSPAVTQLCVVGFEPWKNTRGIPGSSDLFYSQPALSSCCVSITAEKYRDTSGGDLQTSGGSPVFQMFCPSFLFAEC